MISNYTVQYDTIQNHSRTTIIPELMQGLSPSKNTEGYFVLQVGSTLSKDAIIHYLREDISEFSVQAGSHLSLQKLPLTGSPRCLSYLVGGSFSSFDTFVEYAVKTLGAKMKQLWETRNIPRSFFFPGTACPSLDTQEASGACWWRPQARSSRYR